MTDAPESDQKTEHPTAKRIIEAREKGQLPISREVATWTLFLAILIILMWLGPLMANQILASMRIFIEAPHQISLEGNGLQVAAGQVMTKIAIATLLSFALLGFAVVFGVMAQTGFYFNTSKLILNFQALMPVHGFKQLFSMMALVELGKSFVKMVVIGAIVLSIFEELLDTLPLYTGAHLINVMVYMHKEVVHITTVILIIVFAIAVLDLLYQRYTYFKNLRMTKVEVKDERKQLDGDPVVKGRLRQMRLEKARRRMIAMVPKADVVVTNPTHYAVALQYDSTKMAAPVVLAKGVNLIADRIREVATEHEVPLVSNPPLARALYDTVEIDHPISASHYRAVAEVISYVYKLRQKKR